jgi:DNA-binding NarL/FixJ family response regulator
MTDHPTRPLTERQSQVAELVAAGLTNAEIAAMLGISAGGVKRHLEDIAIILDGPGSLRVRIVRYVLRRDAA